MSKAILLSIHPKWAKKIYSGEKTVEWRKNIPNELFWGMTVYLYETSPVSLVTGYFVLDNPVMVDMNVKPGWLEQIMIRNGCVTEDDLRKYQGKSERIYGWTMRYREKFDTPKTLASFGLVRPPQSWQYVEEK